MHLQVINRACSNRRQQLAMLRELNVLYIKVDFLCLSMHSCAFGMLTQDLFQMKLNLAALQQSVIIFQVNHILP